MLDARAGAFDVRLIDLGSAISLASDRHLAPARRGTHMFHSVEQHDAFNPSERKGGAGGGGGGGGVVGEGRVGLKSDVFSLGLTCLTVMTGHDPWEGRAKDDAEQRSIIRAHIDERRNPSSASASAMEAVLHVDPTIHWRDTWTDGLSCPRAIIECLRQTFQIQAGARPRARDVADTFALVAANPVPALTHFPFFD